MGSPAPILLFAMPWQGADALPTSLWAAVLVILLAGSAAAWIMRSIASPRSWMLVAVGVMLCFTGSAAVALHEVAFDPVGPSVAILLASLGGWFVNRRQPSSASADQAVENRPVFVLTAGLSDEAALRSRLGPREFLALTGAFRKRATGLLKSRQALVLPGSGDSLQACFGVPQATPADAENAALTSLLLARALEEYFRQQSSPAPTFKIALQHGTATTGMVEGSYEVAGEVLEECRHLWDRASCGMVITDAVTAELLPDSAHGVEIGNGLWRLIDGEPETVLAPAPVVVSPTSEVETNNEPSIPSDPMPMVVALDSEPEKPVSAPPAAKKKKATKAPTAEGPQPKSTVKAKTSSASAKAAKKKIQPQVK